MTSTTPSQRLIRGARDALGRIAFDGETMDFSGAADRLDPADFSIIDPRIGSMRGTVGVCLDGAEWALPSRCRVSPGRGVLFVAAPGGDLHVLVGRGGRMRELIVPADFAARVRRERFDRARFLDFQNERINP